MTKTAICGVRFVVQYPPYFGDIACERELWHDDPHEAGGFVWGPKDQRQDIFVGRMRRAVEERAQKRRAWYRRLAR